MMNFLMIIFFLQININSSTLLIGIEFLLKLPSGEEVEAAAIVGDLLRVNAKQGPSHDLERYERKIASVQARKAWKLISDQKYYEKMSRYTEGGEMTPNPKVFSLWNEAIAFAGDGLISMNFKEMKENGIPPPPDRTLKQVLNTCFVHRENVLRGAALATQASRLYFYEDCLKKNCWSSNDLADGMDRVVGGELQKHVKLVGYGSGSDTLKKKLKEYYKSDRIVRTSEALFEDIKSTYLTLYEIQKKMNHVFVSNSFSGLIISKQNNEFVSERLEHYDQDVEHMVKRGILISGDDFIRRGIGGTGEIRRRIAMERPEGSPVAEEGRPEATAPLAEEENMELSGSEPELNLPEVEDHELPKTAGASQIVEAGAEEVEKIAEAAKVAPMAIEELTIGLRG